MSENELRAQIAELQSLLETSEQHVAELRSGIAHIIWVLKEKQPAPRSLSVYYTAGYARAMDDMKQAIVKAVSNEMVTQARLVQTDFVKETQEQLEVNVGVDAVAEMPILSTYSEEDKEGFEL